MRVDPLPQELDASLDDEVAGHPLPDEVELVFLRPHVHAASRERVLLLRLVVSRRAGDLRPPDVAVRLELTDGAALCSRGGRNERGKRKSGDDDAGQWARTTRSGWQHDDLRLG